MTICRTIASPRPQLLPVVAWDLLLVVAVLLAGAAFAQALLAEEAKVDSWAEKAAVGGASLLSMLVRTRAGSAL